MKATLDWLGYAKDNDLIIVSKDADMRPQLSVWKSAESYLATAWQLLDITN